MNLKQLLTTVARQLGAQEAELILLQVLQRPLNNRAWLILQGEIELSASVVAQVQNFVRQRQQHVPLAYLLGSCEFYGLELAVNRFCLVPRAATETLVEIADQLVTKHIAPVNQQPACLDLGTGSGAIILALKSIQPAILAYGLDICFKALTIAQANSQNLNLPVYWLQSSWGTAFKANSFDLIVSNPPYISYDELHLMNAETSFEPGKALFAANNGLAAYQRILENAYNVLRPKGWLCLEHGFQQAEALNHALLDAGFADVKCFKDLSGQDRVTIGRKEQKTSLKASL